jgi:hypothetical protein
MSQFTLIASWDCLRAVTFRVSLGKQAAGHNRQARRGSRRRLMLEGSRIQVIFVDDLIHYEVRDDGVIHSINTPIVK